MNRERAVENSLIVTPNSEIKTNLCGFWNIWDGKLARFKRPSSNRTRTNQILYPDSHHKALYQWN